MCRSRMTALLQQMVLPVPCATRVCTGMRTRCADLPRKSKDGGFLLRIRGLACRTQAEAQGDLIKMNISDWSCKRCCDGFPNMITNSGTDVATYCGTNQAANTLINAVARAVTTAVPTKSPSRAPALRPQSVTCPPADVYTISGTVVGLQMVCWLHLPAMDRYAWPSLLRKGQYTFDGSLTFAKDTCITVTDVISIPRDAHVNYLFHCMSSNHKSLFSELQAFFSGIHQFQASAILSI